MRQFEVFGSINNLFDKSPPFTGGGISGASRAVPRHLWPRVPRGRAPAVLSRGEFMNFMTGRSTLAIAGACARWR